MVPTIHPLQSPGHGAGIDATPMARAEGPTAELHGLPRRGSTLARDPVAVIISQCCARVIRKPRTGAVFAAPCPGLCIGTKGPGNPEAIRPDERRHLRLAARPRVIRSSPCALPTTPTGPPSACATDATLVGCCRPSHQHPGAQRQPNRLLAPATSAAPPRADLLSMDRVTHFEQGHVTQPVTDTLHAASPSGFCSVQSLRISTLYV